MSDERTTIHIPKPTKEERELLRVLTPAERLAAMVEAARRKIAQLADAAREGGEQG